MSNTKRLHQVVLEWCGKKSLEQTSIPTFITESINPKFTVRPYQVHALQYFINYWEEAFDGKPRQNHQLLFHMATGSGKTLMMACLMVYLYKKGYRNFLFFVNSTNIINKTRDNFLNKNSGKYLFDEQISIGDKRINIKEVENFQAVNNDDMNIVFSTIQGLHMALNVPRENSLTYDDFEDKKIVLISDEAHHINAETKKGTELSQDELFETVSWEGTVQKIFNSNPGNLLLEFTATVDFTDPFLEQKYAQKLIFDYPLRQFRKDGYSKEVKVMQADLNPFERGLQAVILSQYRRKIFEKYGKAVKPVILFKSKTIKESLEFYDEFKNAIQSLEPSTILTIAGQSADPALQSAMTYFNTNGISPANLIAEFKVDFAEERLISVNSKEESDEKQLAVNSLEDNDFRVVFAVDKLNEGWDVLNLFDIVRLYDKRDSKGGKIGKTTMSEAQLIGRGARYFPFQITDDQPLYGRKYDSDLENELRICEELYYHSAYNPKYIQELNQALQAIGIKAKTTTQRSIKVKDTFKATRLFKTGHIFLNERVKYAREDINTLDSTLITNPFKHELYTGYTTTTTAFEVRQEQGSNRKSKDHPLSSFGTAVIRKAIQRLEFYEFSNLKKYLPNLKSINEFITSESYLGKLVIEFSGSPEQVGSPSLADRLDATTALLEVIAEVIVSDKVEFKGTFEFKPRMLREVFTDKVLNFMLDEGTEQEFGKSMNDPGETAYHLDLATKKWYVFNDCFGTSEEKLLIQYIDKRHDELCKIYSEVYLLRNERHFKLYAYQDGRALEPDFVLYLVGKEPTNTMHYQVFIEPKGSHLLRADKWKEDFLVEIKGKHQIEQLFSSKKHVAWGLPFFNSAERSGEFETGFKELIEV
jgi:type III restriction enzyme